MKKLFKLSVLVIIYIVNFNSISLAEKTLKLSKLKGSKMSFIAECILQEAYQQLGMVVNFQAYPPKRALEYANKGIVDGDILRIKGIDQKYNNLVMVPISINKSEVMVFTKDKHFIVEGWESLRPYRIGILKGRILVEKGTKGMNIDSVATDTNLIKMLISDRIDICVIPKISGLSILNELKLQKKIRMLEPPVVKVLLYHYLHKKHLSLVTRLTKVLSQMEKDGRIQEIREKYINEYIQKLHW